MLCVVCWLLQVSCNVLVVVYCVALVVPFARFVFFVVRCLRVVVCWVLYVVYCLLIGVVVFVVCCLMGVMGFQCFV